MSEQTYVRVDLDSMIQQCEWTAELGVLQSLLDYMAEMDTHPEAANDTDADRYGFLTELIRDMIADRAAYLP